MDIGAIGEDLLQSWSSKTNIVCQKPDKDQFGWDRLLEFYPVSNKKKSYDLQLDKIKCFVQVKTTQDKKIPVKIKLSNWDNMVKNPLPFFILYIILDSTGEMTEVFLTHIYTVTIEKVLKKIRELNNEKLCNRDMIYKPNASDEILDFTPLKLKERIIEYIGEDINLYTSNKTKIIRNIGYDKYPYILNFQSDATMDEMIDFSIGIEKQINIKNVVIKDNRFNIPFNIDNFDLGLLDNSKTKGTTLSLRFFNENVTSEFSAELYTPTIIRDRIPVEKVKFRVESPVCELIFHSDGRLSYNINFRIKDFKQTVNGLLSLSKFIQIMTDNRYDRFLELHFHDMKYRNLFENKRDLGFDDETKFIAQMIDNLHFISNYTNISLDQEISLDSLYTYKDQITEIRTFLDIRFHNNILLNLKNKKSNHDVFEDASIIGKEIAIPRILYFIYSEKAIVIYGYYHGFVQKPSEDSKDLMIQVHHKYESFEIKELIDNKIDISNKRDKLIESIDDKYLIISM